MMRTYNASTRTIRKKGPGSSILSMLPRRRQGRGHRKLRNRAMSKMRFGSSTASRDCSSTASKAGSSKISKVKVTI